MNNPTCNEYRIFGPPGCGKTTALAQRVIQLSKQFEPSTIIIASLTRTAAAEIAGRDLPLEDDQVGTLHSFAYRAIGRPKVAEKDKHLVAAWNKAHPEFALGKEDRTVDDPYGDNVGNGQVGRQLLQKLSAYRAALRTDPLGNDVAVFAEHWNKFKIENDAVDFTDMIEYACRDCEKPPGDYSIMVLDEVQDFSPLELALARKWGAEMKMLIMAGDDDQSLYYFRGSTPDAFLLPAISEDHIQRLEQSYRVPKVIQQMASAWIIQVAHRENKPYKPTTSTGDITILPFANWRYPEPILQDIVNRTTGDTMILASCGFMLEPLLAILKRNGIAFHNPYRPNRRDWNPLNGAAKKQLLSYLAPKLKSRLWTINELQTWVEVVQAENILVHGAKAQIARIEATGALPIEEIKKFFVSGLLETLVEKNCPLEWLEKYIVPSKKVGMEFVFRIAKTKGVEALTKQPDLTIGTIHSVKGGEAENVYLFPDLSPTAAQECESNQSSRDAVTRMFYVGMTRAKQSLMIIGAVNPERSVDLESYTKEQPMTTLSDKAHAVRDAAVTRATMLSRYLDLRAWLTEAKALLFDSGDYDKPLPESEQADFDRKVAKFIRWLGEYESLVRQLAEMPGALASATCACGGLVLAPWDKECLNCWQARQSGGYEG